MWKNETRNSQFTSISKITGGKRFGINFNLKKRQRKKRGYRSLCTQDRTVHFPFREILK